MTQEQWRQLIDSKMQLVAPPIQAVGYSGTKWQSFSRPALLLCVDAAGNELDCVVKTPYHSGIMRPLCTDQILAYVGRCIGCPIPPTPLVDVPQALLDRNLPALAELVAGIAHGSIVAEKCGERLMVEYAHVPENRERFARIAVFYCLACASDLQMIYGDKPPHLVYSVDHGHFLPNSPYWNIRYLATHEATNPYQIKPELSQHCNFTQQEIADAVAQLRLLTDDEIATAVAHPPSTWGISMGERAALAEMLAIRRDDIQALPGLK